MHAKSMMASFVKESTDAGPIPILDILGVLGHSMALGIILVISTYLAGQILESRGKSKILTEEETVGSILGAANLLFLCVGLTGIMLLISNSVVRAFAIVAVIALVRFRVKLSQKEINTSFLFSILVGMACGVNELAIAWTVAGVYIFLLLLLLGVVFLTRKSYQSQKEASIFKPAQPNKDTLSTLNTQTEE